MTDKFAFGPANDRDEDWLVHNVNHKAHFMKRVGETTNPYSGVTIFMWETSCGRHLYSNNHWPMLDSGNWPRCLRCEAAQRATVARKSGRAA
ncbi:MAG: hypothetical protein V7688_12740 [Alcanivorax jadensis]|uniref:hypothetical protein n=1 Tax=Alcanivorax jadensis TaxID=64988 RepID=UPI0030031024